MASKHKRGRRRNSARRLPRYRSGPKKGQFKKRGHRSYKSFNGYMVRTTDSFWKAAARAHQKKLKAAARKARRKRGKRRNYAGLIGRERKALRGAARLRSLGGTKAAAVGLEASRAQARKAARRAAGRKAARTRAAKKHKRSLAAKRAARKRKGHARRRAAPHRKSKGRKSSVAKRKHGRSKAKRKAAARKAAATRARKHAARVRAGKKAARARKRRGHRGKRGKRRAILRVRRHGRSVSALCKAANRKHRRRRRRNAGYRKDAGSSGVLQLNRKHRRRRGRRHGARRHNELPVIGGFLKKIPGGAYLDQAVPYIGGGIVGVLGSNVLPRYIPGNQNKWLSLLYSVLGTSAAAWGSHKFLKSEKLALGAAVVGGFSVLAKIVATFVTDPSNPIRSLVGIGMSDLEGYAGLGDQLELADNYGTAGGFQQDFLDYADGSIPTGGEGVQGAGAVGADGISTSDDDMADMIEMQDFAEIR